ncbi:uncharacterized protein DFL_008035 [Arthrobotrys flagrans]|uniref:Ketoreductase (KR) domain-containing protein n=1 Tax=Arthrobotrys flagrans TaxID=97331 RepID=A0A436ZMM5_ARTFL|nr:hypothetical protein DFL_008035 [Arthrobotrys flagrans]
MSSISPIPALFSTPGKIAVVTGGSRGLGLHAATGLLLSGCSKVYITSRKVSACEEAVKALNAINGIQGKAISVPADISKPEEITRFVKELEKDTDHVDILVANAGATWGAPYGSWKKEYWDKVMNLNVTSVFLLVQEMTPSLPKTPQSPIPPALSPPPQSRESKASQPVQTPRSPTQPPKPQ